MLITEYRIVLPIDVTEYQVAQLYSVALISKHETGGGDGIEVLKNEPFSLTSGVQPKTPLCNGAYTSGQYTSKAYYLEQKVPTIIQKIAPNGSLIVREDAWNSYPFCRTVITNDYMKENFFVKVETIHLPDRGETENAHGLDEKTLKQRKLIRVDIANDSVDMKDYKPEYDPKIFKSTKTGRGPLEKNWSDSCQPVMCCYKLVTVNFKWFGLQTQIERVIMRTEHKIFLNFHRQLFCSIDNWFEMSMNDIRDFEKQIKNELDVKRKNEPLSGSSR